MPGASIIDDLGEKQSQVKMSLVALRNSVCNCEPQSVALASKLKKKKSADILCYLVKYFLFDFS